RVAGAHAATERLQNPLLDGGAVFARHRAADDLVLELEALAGLVRLSLEVDVAVLAATAGLPHVTPLRLGVLPDRLAIRHLRLADVRLDLELAQQPVDHDLEAQLAHPTDERLGRLLVA